MPQTMLVKILLLIKICLIVSSCASPATVVVYCPQWPDVTEEEREDLRNRIPDNTPSFRWFQRLYVLKAELDACEGQNDAGN